MAETRYQTQVRTQSRAEIDQGLRSYMLGVYNYMALGVAATAIITMLVASSPAAMQAVYSLKWVFQAFLITAITFGATSLAGYVTKRDLSGFSSFFMMASIGIIVAILINAFFVQSTMMSLITSIITVLLFAGITAYETQQIKEMYVEGDAPGIARGKSIFGAFMLYGSFITLFINILNILGIMRQN